MQGALEVHRVAVVLVIHIDAAHHTAAWIGAQQGGGGGEIVTHT